MGRRRLTGNAVRDDTVQEEEEEEEFGMTASQGTREGGRSGLGGLKQLLGILSEKWHSFDKLFEPTSTVRNRNSTSELHLLREPEFSTASMENS